MNHNPKNQPTSSRTPTILMAVLALVCLFVVALYFYKPPRKIPAPVFAGDTLSQLQIHRKIACPPTGSDTLVVFGIGQSNAGNHGPAVEANAVANPHVFEYWRGSCYLAASPALGATGSGESLWPSFGQALIASGIAKNVIFRVFSVDGASIQRFASPTDLQPYWVHALQELLVEHPVDYVLWIQGEADFARKTSQKEYVRMFRKVESKIRAQKVTAPILVSRQTYCSNSSLWEPNNPVAIAQIDLVNPLKGIFAGPDTDQILGSAEKLRWDDCHPSLLGFRQWAFAWTELIGKYRKQ
jgi:Carbohydrate esterase, sialic acid-specific acetylesterase